MTSPATGARCLGRACRCASQRSYSRQSWPKRCRTRRGRSGRSTRRRMRWRFGDSRASFCTRFCSGFWAWARRTLPAMLRMLSREMVRSGGTANRMCVCIERYILYTYDRKRIKNPRGPSSLEDSSGTELASGFGVLGGISHIRPAASDPPRE